MDLCNQHVIITGGSSGIGRAIARRLAQRGADISIIARRQGLLEETLDELESLRVNGPQRLAIHSADLTDMAQTQQAVATLTAEDHPPDILINSAGFAHPGHFEELSIDIFRSTIDIDYLGTVQITKLVAPMMIARHKGHIVNFSSMAGYLPVFGYSAYCPAKYAVRGFSDVLRFELRPHGIYVSVVFPPDTDTPQLCYENQFKPLVTKRITGTVKAMTADKVAQAVILGIERHEPYISPSFEGRVLFLLTDGLGGLFRWYVDQVVTRTYAKRTT